MPFTDVGYTKYTVYYLVSTAKARYKRNWPENPMGAVLSLAKYLESIRLKFMEHELGKNDNWPLLEQAILADKK